jgi:CRISPR/Cas system-associated endonuclease Cas1
MATANQILNKNDDVQKFLGDALENALSLSSNRITGNINDDEYKNQVEKLRNQVKMKVENERKIALLKKAQQAELAKQKANLQQQQQQQNNIIKGNSESKNTSI